MLGQDKKIKSGIFPGEMIIVEYGKLIYSFRWVQSREAWGNMGTTSNEMF
jgi:hypothetical protein